MACMRALLRVLERDFRFLKVRGMRLTKVSDDLIVLEDLDEWLSTYQDTLEAKCPGKLIFNVYSQPTDNTMHMSSFRVSIMTSDYHWCMHFVNYALACFSVFIFVCWMHVVYQNDVGNLRSMAFAFVNVSTVPEL